MAKLAAGGAAAALFLAGCGATRHNLSPLALVGPPAVRTDRSPDLDSAKFYTFSVFPVSKFSSTAGLKAGSYEDEMLFIVRCAFEARGFTFVAVNENPDFLVTVDTDMPEAGAPPPTSLQLPERKAGNALALDAPLSGLFTPELRQQYAGLGWGALPEPDDMKGLFPGKSLLDSLKPGQEMRGTLTIVVLDGHNLNELWVGVGGGVSAVPSFKVAGQAIIWNMVNEFPRPPMAERRGSAAELMGIDYRICTNDGVRYYPAIIGLDPKRPSNASGDIGTYDVVLAVGGETVVNRPYSKVMHRLGGPPGIQINVTLWRLGEQINTYVVPQPPPVQQDAATILAPEQSAPGANRISIPATAPNLKVLKMGCGVVGIGVLIAIFLIGGM